MSLISSMTLGRNPVAPVRFINSENGLVIHYVAWTPPPEDFWKLNFASFSTSGSERAGIGCVIRDQNAIFKHAVSASAIGYQHSVEVELKALIFGLREAVKLGVDYLEIEGESEAAMKVLLGEISPTSHMCVLALSECVTIIGSFRKVRFHPVYDYVNRAARKLAKISMDAEEVASWSTETPPAIADILSEDVVGRYDFADSVV